MAEDHEHGEMDIDVQEKTFDGFIKITTYSVIGIFIFLVLLALINA
ncbi:MAG: aa3-type cytochrome c oxidase subunit IV [Pseudomonadota bacterium]